jgi:hypothetical protein
MPAKASCLRDVGLQNVSLAQLERSMRCEHRQRWQAPQQNEQPSGDPPSPVAAADQDNHGNDARRGQNDVSRPPQRNQIGIILVGRSEYENRTSEPDQDEADTFEDLHERMGLPKETIARIKLVTRTRAHKHGCTETA